MWSWCCQCHVVQSYRNHNTICDEAHLHLQVDTINSSALFPWLCSSLLCGFIWLQGAQIKGDGWVEVPLSHCQCFHVLIKSFTVMMNKDKSAKHTQSSSQSTQQCVAMKCNKDQWSTCHMLSGIFSSQSFLGCPPGRHSCTSIKTRPAWLPYLCSINHLICLHHICLWVILKAHYQMVIIWVMRIIM